MKVSAAAMERSERCTLCGTAEHEWEEDYFAYHPVQLTCRGCQLKETLSGDDTPMPKGTSVRLVPKAVAARLAAEQAARARSGVSTVPRRRRPQ